MKNMPDILYKYTNTNTALKILEDSSIHFTNPFCFNDPYDANPPFIVNTQYNISKKLFEKFLKEQKNRSDFPEEIQKYLDDIENIEINISPQEFYEILSHKFKNSVRTLCLSEYNNNLLMWGHYADSYKGLVIGFDTNFIPFKNARKVEYCNCPIEIKGKYLEDFALKKEATRQEILSIYLSKNIAWQYEREWRFVSDIVTIKEKMKKSSLDRYNLQLELLKETNFIHIPFPQISIKNIYLGCEMNIIDQDIIINLVKKKYPFCQIYKSKLSKCDYKINFELC